MSTRGRALVGFAVLMLIVNVVAGARLHLHPGHEDTHGRTLVHSHGTGAPHSHEPAPRSSTDQSEQGGGDGAVLLLAALRALPAPGVAATVIAPMFLPEPAVVIAVPATWRQAPESTPFDAHGPPSSPHLPARAPPSGPFQFS